MKVGWEDGWEVSEWRFLLPGGSVIPLTQALGAMDIPRTSLSCSNRKKPASGAFRGVQFRGRKEAETYLQFVPDPLLAVPERTADRTIVFRD